MNRYFSIIIPNYNGIEFLKTCLDSIYSQSFKDFELIIVDDASTDQSVEFVKKNYPNAKIIRLEQNSGFSKVVNRGIKEAKGEHLFILNNDTKLDKDCLLEIKNAIDKNREFDIFACKILSMDDPAKIDSAGDGYSLIGNPYKIGYKQKDGPKYQSPKEVFGACAAAAVYKRTIFQDIGGFDEDFVYYNEDSDLNFRARLKGYRCLYVPGAIVYHKLMATGKKNLGRVIYYINRNKINLIIKNLPTKIAVKYFPFLIVGRIRDLSIALIKGHFFSGISGIFMALLTLPKMLKKRKEIQTARTTSDKDLEELLDCKFI